MGGPLKKFLKKRPGQPDRFTKRYMAKLVAEHARDRGAEFCAAWWANARKEGPAPAAKEFGLSPAMADVLHRACLAEWKGGKR